MQWVVSLPITISDRAAGTAGTAVSLAGLRIADIWSLDKWSLDNSTREIYPGFYPKFAHFKLLFIFKA